MKKFFILNILFAVLLNAYGGVNTDKKKIIEFNYKEAVKEYESAFKVKKNDNTYNLQDNNTQELSLKGSSIIDGNINEPLDTKFTIQYKKPIKEKGSNIFIISTEMSNITSKIYITIDKKGNIIETDDLLGVICKADNVKNNFPEVVKIFDKGIGQSMVCSDGTIHKSKWVLMSDGNNAVLKVSGNHYDKNNLLIDSGTNYTTFSPDSKIISMYIVLEIVDQNGSMIMDLKTIE